MVRRTVVNSGAKADQAEYDWLLHSPQIGEFAPVRFARNQNSLRADRDPAAFRATLDELRQAHGYALLWDAHSIPSRVPRLFDGELPVLNLGNFDGRSCDAAVAGELYGRASASPYSAVLNGRFKGGYITRRYGDPPGGVQAVQLELAQRAYMSEQTLELDPDLANRCRDTLRELLTAYTRAAAVQ